MALCEGAGDVEALTAPGERVLPRSSGLVLSLSGSVNGSTRPLLTVPAPDAGCGAWRAVPEQSCRTDHLGAQPGVASAGQGTKRAIPGQATHSDPRRSCHGEGSSRSLGAAVSGSFPASGIWRLPPPSGMLGNHKQEGAATRAFPTIRSPHLQLTHPKPPPALSHFPNRAPGASFLLSFLPTARFLFSGALTVIPLIAHLDNSCVNEWHSFPQATQKCSDLGPPLCLEWLTWLKCVFLCPSIPKDFLLGPLSISPGKH